MGAIISNLNSSSITAIVTTSHHISSANHNGHHMMGSKGSSRTGTFVKSYQTMTVKGYPLSNGNNGNGIMHEPYSNIHRMNHFSSSTSLQTEMANSNNVSPVSSPLPTNSSFRSMPISNVSNSPKLHTSLSTMSRMNSNSNLKSMKRWSASQEIRLSSLEHSK